MKLELFYYLSFSSSSKINIVEKADYDFFLFCFIFLIIRDKLNKNKKLITYGLGFHSINFKNNILLFYKIVIFKK